VVQGEVPEGSELIAERGFPRRSMPKLKPFNFRKFVKDSLWGWLIIAIALALFIPWIAIPIVLLLVGIIVVGLGRAKDALAINRRRPSQDQAALF
jgi:hypothetical protein